MTSGWHYDTEMAMTWNGMYKKYKRRGGDLDGDFQTVEITNDLV